MKTHAVSNAKNDTPANLTIVVAGKTGAGKSTLINSVFEQNLCPTALGRPVTQSIRKLSKTGFPLTIFDTPGFELEATQQNKVKSEIISLISKGVESRDISQAIRCVLYCINVQSNRIEQKEVDWLKEFLDEESRYRVPVIIVLTIAAPKSKAQSMLSELINFDLNIFRVLPVLAQDFDIDGEYTAKAYGVNDLVDVIMSALPAEVKSTFACVQKISLEAKHKSARTAIATAAVAAAGVAFAPIPFSDAALLIPTQVAMIASITTIYGFDLNP